MTAVQQDRFEPFFIDGEKGRLFALLRAPASATDIVIIVPPFGEEMNKSRKQFAETADDIVAAGKAVLQFDLFGTGDSDGEFEEADWPTWKQDVLTAIEWTRGSGFDCFSLLALRLGCTLAAEALAGQNAAPARTVLQQPVATGSQFMTQFLRLRVAASMMNNGDKETVDQLKNRLDANETIEISGYAVSGSLWRGIEDSSLTDCCQPTLGKVRVLEVGRERPDGVSPAARKIIEAAVANGVNIDGQRVTGEPFWSATEIVLNAELRSETVNFLTMDAVQ